MYSYSSGGEKSQIKGWADSVSGETLPGLQMAAFLLGPQREEEKWDSGLF